MRTARNNAGLRKKHALQLFKTDMCKFYLRNRCENGDGCSYAHSLDEVRSKPDLTATSMCRTLLQLGGCTDPTCRFAHAESELRATHGFFKMKMCGFAQSGRCKHGEACRFAHSPEELRPARPLPPPGGEGDSMLEARRHYEMLASTGDPAASPSSELSQAPGQYHHALSDSASSPGGRVTEGDAPPVPPLLVGSLAAAPGGRRLRERRGRKGSFQHGSGFGQAAAGQRDAPLGDVANEQFIFGAHPTEGQSGWSPWSSDADLEAPAKENPSSTPHVGAQGSTGTYGIVPQWGLPAPSPTGRPQQGEQDDRGQNGKVPPVLVANVPTYLPQQALAAAPMVHGFEDRQMSTPNQEEQVPYTRLVAYMMMPMEQIVPVDGGGYGANTLYQPSMNQGSIPQGAGWGNESPSTFPPAAPMNEPQMQPKETLPEWGQWVDEVYSD